MSTEVVVAIITGCTTILGILVSWYFKHGKENLEKEIEKIRAEESSAVNMSEVVVEAQKAAQNTAAKAYKSQIDQLQSDMGDLRSTVVSTEKEIENVRERAREDRENYKEQIEGLRDQANEDRKRANMALRNADRRIYRLSSLITSTQNNIELLGAHIDHATISAENADSDLVSKLQTLKDLQERAMTSLEESSATKIDAELEDNIDII